MSASSARVLRASVYVRAKGTYAPDAVELAMSKIGMHMRVTAWHVSLCLPSPRIPRGSTFDVTAHIPFTRSSCVNSADINISWLSRVRSSGRACVLYHDTERSD